MAHQCSTWHLRVRLSVLVSASPSCLSIRIGLSRTPPSWQAPPPPPLSHRRQVSERILGSSPPPTHTRTPPSHHRRQVSERILADMGGSRATAAAVEDPLSAVMLTSEVLELLGAAAAPLEPVFK